ncbi:MAG: phosphoenolpyruvate--protein phosphotransferase, partial [Lentisphaerae bacterium]|nr:phosphoenolpyruvate--protein phosphotransferase [Lentisphaerota bacterium]
SQALSKATDEYLRERVADVNDITRRIKANLTGDAESPVAFVKAGSVIVAHDMLPSEIVSIDRTKVVGIAIDSGSPTSHAAILAGKLGIPTVVGLNNISAAVRSGDQVLIDGNKGLVIIRPLQERLDQYKKIAEARKQVAAGLKLLKDLPAETKDGYRVMLSANIEQVNDLDAVLASGADGIGLFRTEYFFMTRSDIPTEEEQFEAYREVAERVSPSATIIRTLDLGGDKFISKLDMSWKESNPFMGWRAIRFCLAQPDLFRTQLRAILRASVFGNIKIMYPMISNVDEIVRANLILENAKKELLERGVPFDPKMEVGAMIEVPSAAMVADTLASYVDFFSLGTNDLVQYTLAIDRGNERVAYLYEPTHLAVLRLIKSTVDAGPKHGIWTGICGGMGGDPMLVPLLIGLGINEFSVNPPLLPVVKDAIRSITYSDARDIAEAALYAPSVADIQDLSRRLTEQVAPEILELVD